MKSVLSIAGSDSSGGAGIQADLKTMLANGVYGMSVITALTAQNTMGVTGIVNVDATFVGMQLDAVFTDIFPDAVKTGMLSVAETIRVVAAKLREYGAHNIVVDPVMVATSGAKLINADALSTLKKELFPLAAVLTPNIPEAEVLADFPIDSAADMERAAETIGNRYGCAVLCKGGHMLNAADDLLYADGHFSWFRGRRIENPNTHGTGCTLSSAIAANLAFGVGLAEAITGAKDYLSDALGAMLSLGHGHGPIDHGCRLHGAISGHRQ